MSNFNSTLTQSRLIELLHYDAETGLFTRRVRSARMAAGSAANSLDTSTGYIRFGVEGKLHYAHRLAWLYIYGKFPAAPTIDHINRIRTDNRICNLREATHLLQGSNHSKTKNPKTSQYIGVNWSKGMRKFEAAIVRNGTRCRIGYFDCEHEAGEAYIRAKIHLDTFTQESCRGQLLPE